MVVRAERKSHDVRRAEVLDTAIALSHIHGYRNLKREYIAKRMKCSDSLVSMYFKNGALPVAIMKAAVKHEILEIIVQGMACRDKLVRNLPQATKQKVVDFLLS
jgi:AcrR family transcriptional regulator